MNFDDNSLYNIKSSVDGKRYSLFELATWKNGLAFKKINFCETGVPVIKIAELNNGIGGTTAYTQQTFSEDVHLCKGDLLFSWSGNPQTSIDIFRFNLDEGWLNQHIFKVTPDEKIVDRDYFYFLMKNLKPHFTQIATNKQTTGLGHVTIADIKRMSVVIPSLDVQREMVSYIKPIDDKIELNNEINNNLAEQSQAIFAEFMCKYPYVLSPLGDMAEIIDCLHSKKPKAVNGTTYQLLQLNNITDSGFLDLSSKYYISKSDYENWTRKCEIVEGDCVITNVGRIGAVSQAPNGTHAAMGRNMTCIRLRNDKPFYSYLITALLSPHIRREIMKNTDEGTIMGALNVKNIPLLLFPMFALPTMNALEDLLSPIRKAIEQNYLSNQMLSLLRDSLLPRLMSGELDVSNIEI